MPQAIVTKYLPPTDRRGARVRATCERGTIVISYPHDSRDAHVAAKDALIARFLKEDAERYPDAKRNPWAAPMIQGGLPKGGEVFVFADRSAAENAVPELIDAVKPEKRPGEGRRRLTTEERQNCVCPDDFEIVTGTIAEWDMVWNHAAKEWVDFPANRYGTKSTPREVVIRQKAL